MQHRPGCTYLARLRNTRVSDRNKVQDLFRRQRGRRWFPPGAGTVVVALYADKAKLGDVVPQRGVGADPMIDQWKRETAYEEKP